MSSNTPPLLTNTWLNHGSGNYQSACRRRGPGSVPGQSTWDQWWSKRQWDSFSLSTPALSLPFHKSFIRIHSSITDAAKSSQLTAPWNTSKKHKSHPITDLDRPWVFKKVDAPKISRQSAYQGDGVVSPAHRPPLPPRNIPGTHFC
jgi:hypothetical protein